MTRISGTSPPFPSRWEIFSISSIQPPPEKGGHAELEAWYGMQPGVVAANVNGKALFLNNEGGTRESEKDRKRVETVANGRGISSAEARDCCARICNSLSICKRQQHLNRERGTGWCLCLVVARDSIEFTYRAGIIYTKNKNHRSLEKKNPRAFAFYSRRRRLRFPVSTAAGTESRIEFRKC